MAVKAKTSNSDFVFEKSERLIVELNDSSIYEGDYLSNTNNRLDICNVVVLTDSDTINITNEVSLYSGEIRSIRGFKMSNNTLRNLHVHKIMTLSYSEFHNLLNQTKHYLYINQINAQYSKAIVYLRKRDVLSVAPLGIETQGRVPINYLVVSTTKRIYIFDMFALNKRDMPEELKEILESKAILKVVHKSQLFVCYLQKCYKVELENFFDLSVADFLIQKERHSVILNNWRSLSEMLSDYYNFPYSLVEDRSLRIDWQEQPLSEFYKKRAALLGGYLLTLRNKLEGIMLKSFYDEVEGRSK